MIKNISELVITNDLTMTGTHLKMDRKTWSTWYLQFNTRYSFIY